MRTDSVYLCGDYLNHPWIEGSIRCGEKVAAMLLEDSAREWKPNSPR